MTWIRNHLSQDHVLNIWSPDGDTIWGDYGKFRRWDPAGRSQTAWLEDYIWFPSSSPSPVPHGINILACHHDVLPMWTDPHGHRLNPVRPKPKVIILSKLLPATLISLHKSNQCSNCIISILYKSSWFVHRQLMKTIVCFLLFYFLWAQ